MTVQTFTLFIDAQNVYNEARRAFFSPTDNHVCGQINPMKLASLIRSQSPAGVTRTLHEVRIYSGRPDSGKDAKTHAAHMKQCAAWTRAGARVITRPLRYPKDWPNSKAQEKGIDVTLAIDIVAFAVDCVHDVAVIASFDTDLQPAIEFVRLRFAKECSVEVIGFNSTQTKKKRLRVPGHNLWCYWLNKADYDAIADFTDYNL